MFNGRWPFFALVDFCVSSGPVRKKCQSATRCARHVLGETPVEDKEAKDQEGGEPSDRNAGLTTVKGGRKRRKTE